MHICFIRSWTCWCWMITSPSWQNPFRLHWCQQSLAMGSVAPPPPVVQASTQTPPLTLSLSQLVTTPMVFTHMPKMHHCRCSNFASWICTITLRVSKMKCKCSLSLSPSHVHHSYFHYTSSLLLVIFSPLSSLLNITITLKHTPSTNPGLLQFQSSPPGDGLIPPALEPAHTTVNEEDGQVRLIVDRAQGLLGRVMVGYRTTPFTASSPEDYEVCFY